MTDSPWQYFTMEELTCQCGCGKMKMDDGYMRALVSIRRELGFGLPVTSGYRCENHPIEAKKSKPGSHFTGKATDVGVYDEQAVRFVESALRHGMTGFGVNQKGDFNKRFIHTDQLRKRMWSY